MSKRNKESLFKELEQLQKERLITDSQLEKIKSKYSKDPEKTAQLFKQSKLAQIFQVMAFILIFIAVVLFIAFPTVSLVVKLIATTILTTLLYASGIITLKKSNNIKIAALTSIFSASVLVLFDLILFVVNFDILLKLNQWTVFVLIFMITSLVYLVTAIEMEHSLFFLLFCPSFITLGFFLILRYSLPITESFVLMGLILFLAGVVNDRTIGTGAALLYLFGAATMLGATFFASNEPQQYFLQTLLAYEIILVIVASLFLRSKILFGIGSLFVPIYLMTLYYQYFSHFMSPIIGLLLLGLILFSAGLLIERKREYIKETMGGLT